MSGAEGPSCVPPPRQGRSRSLALGPGRDSKSDETNLRQPGRGLADALALGGGPQWFLSAQTMFAETIEVEGPTGSPLSSGDHVVLTLSRLSVGELPDLDPRSELKFDVTVRTGSDRVDCAESVVTRASDVDY